MDIDWVAFFCYVCDNTRSESVMTNIRATLQGIVIHQSADRSMEYGIETGLGHRPVPYCKWHRGTECGMVILDHSGDIMVSNDMLIMSVTQMNQRVAMWLIELRLTLSQPKETLLGLVEAGIFSYATEIVDTPGGKTINVFRDKLHRHVPDEILLQFYDWQLQATGHNYNIFIYPS